MEVKDKQKCVFTKMNSMLDSELIIATKDSVPGSFEVPSTIDDCRSPLIVKRIKDRADFEEVLASASDIPLVSLLNSRKSWAEEAFERRSQLRSEDSEASTEDPSLDRETTGFIRGVPLESGLESEPAEGEIYQLADGRVYQGQWLRGKMHGYGVVYCNSGIKYDGTFVAGKKEGHGILTFEDGRIYAGPFENDCMQGSGKFVGSFGEEYNCKATAGSIEVESLQVTSACM